MPLHIDSRHLHLKETATASFAHLAGFGRVARFRFDAHIRPPYRHDFAGNLQRATRICRVCALTQYDNDGGGLRDLPERLPAPAEQPADDGDFEFDWRAEVANLAESLRRDSQGPDSDEEKVELGPERVFLVGVAVKSRQKKYGYNIHESIEELARLADTAGLEVVGSTYQQLESPSPRSYIGSGKVQEIKEAVQKNGANTVIFDDELSPGQQRTLEKMLGGEVRLCDRTALILDIFSQRARTREGQLQVELARSAYQLPRLTRMWSHLERQAGGQTKGMGEKQIEVDKRILRNNMAALRRELEEVRAQRRQQSIRRAEATIPVIGLCGYTNSGKSTLLNRMTSSEAVLAEDTLFATLDPTTRRIELPSGQQALLTDTVGFIQKLPTQLVAAFRATLEVLGESSLLLHVVDVSSPNAAAQTDTVNSILQELDIDLPIVTVWNKVDLCADPELVRRVAAGRQATVCISALTGEGLDALAVELERQLSLRMNRQTVLIPYGMGELVSELHQSASILHEAYEEKGTLITAFMPPSMVQRLQKLNLLMPATAALADSSDADGELVHL